jgi:parallel beta-helix repeat protein
MSNPNANRSHLPKEVMSLLPLIPNLKERRSIQMKGMSKNYRYYFTFFLIILLLIVLSGCDGITPSTPIVYNTNTETDYDTIQEAIDAALDGHTIIVYPGTYYQNIEFDGKSITVRSTDPLNPAVVAATIIDGGGNGSVVRFIEGDSSTLKGFTIQNGSATYFEYSDTIYFLGGGIEVEHSSPHITDNIIEGNSSTHGGGICIAMNSYPTVTGNTITDNTSTTYGGGIFVGESSEILPNTVRPAGWGTGRENIPPYDGLPIAGNTFSGNSHGDDPNDGTDVYFE